jgi:hypothetical protein
LLRISRFNAGIIILIMGVGCMVSYTLASESSVGPIEDLLGLGMLFIFIGLMALAGEVTGYGKEDAR